MSIMDINYYRCVDYVRVIRPRYGTTESCGGDTIEDNRNQLEEGVPTYRV